MSEIQPLLTLIVLVAAVVLNAEFRGSIISGIASSVDDVRGFIGASLFIIVIALSFYYVFKVILANRKLTLGDKWIVSTFHYIIILTVSFGYGVAYILSFETPQELMASQSAWDTVSNSMALYLFIISFVRIVLIRFGGQAPNVRMAASLDDTQYGIFAVAAGAVATTAIVGILGMYHTGFILLALAIMYSQVAAILLQTIKDLFYPPQPTKTVIDQPNIHRYKAR